MLGLNRLFYYWAVKAEKIASASKCSIVEGSEKSYSAQQGAVDAAQENTNKQADKTWNIGIFPVGVFNKLEYSNLSRAEALKELNRIDNSISCGDQVYRMGDRYLDSNSSVTILNLKNIAHVTMFKS